MTNLGRRAGTCFRSLCEEDDGQDMVEYSLLLAFIALAAVGLLSGIKVQIKGLWSTIGSTLSSTNTAAS